MTNPNASIPHPLGELPRISYGQNAEDVRLWRVFDSIEQGCYVEVGAWEPERDSISFSFYQRGWRGVVVEPVTEYAQAFRRRRPDDCVVQCLAGEAPGTAEFTVFPGTGLSTSVTPFAERHAAEGIEHHTLTAEVRRLDDIIRQCGMGAEIHFMSVDVEGAEESVLRGIDLTRFRPWILVVEATEPRSTVRATAWKPLLLEHGYQEVVSDGLNSYFVANEHAQLGDLLIDPPSALDNYRTFELAQALEGAGRLQQDLAVAQQNLEALNERCDSLNAELQDSQREVADLRGTVHELTRKLADLRDSASWRMTAPLRKVRSWRQS